MRVITARNVHSALPIALDLLEQEGIQRDSRNGPVKIAPWPVTTVYEKPCERVLFWPERDANPAYHLYEALWMLGGRNDVAPLVRYAKNAQNYSDDGRTWHGAYGFRWRKYFGIDQLEVIAKQIRDKPDDRRSVLTMWDVTADLGKQGKDFPCNIICSFQRDINGALDLTVFCRSNDIWWGCYGANSVHFSMLLEYMAIWVGCPVGLYRQISVNWHGYLTTLPTKRMYPSVDRYGFGTATWFPMTEPRHGESPDNTIKRLDKYIEFLLFHADSGFTLPRLVNDDEPWVDTVYAVLKAYELWRSLAAPERFEEAFKVLDAQPRDADWIIAATEWIERRKVIWESKQLAESK
jgi:hypothetical protein